jgi:hypothetical protein
MSLTLSADHRVFDGQVGGTDILIFTFVFVSTIITIFKFCAWFSYYSLPLSNSPFLCTGEQGGFSRSWHQISVTLGDCFCKWKEVDIVFWRILCGNAAQEKRTLRCNSGLSCLTDSPYKSNQFCNNSNKKELAPPECLFSPFNVSWEEARRVLRIDRYGATFHV